MCSGNSWLAPNYDVYSPASPSATLTPANYYGASMTAQSQCIAVGNVLTASTTDFFNQIVKWADPAAGGGQNAAAAMLLDGNLLLTCGGGGDKPKHLALRSNAGATVLTGSAARLMLGTHDAFSSLECNANGSAIVRAVTTLRVAADPASATLTDYSNNPAGETSSFDAAQLDALFSSRGLILTNGKTLRWVLYVEPIQGGGLTKQAIVHTAVQADGSINLLSFVRP